MKKQYRLALGAIAVSWAVSCAAWVASDIAAARRDTAAAAADSGRPRRDQSFDDGWKRAPANVKHLAILAVVGQLNAFKADDYPRAVKYQSTELRRNFVTAAEFRATIRHSYPEFADYKTVEFGDAHLSPRHDHLAMAATVTGMNGREVRAIYYLNFENNSYHINGVRSMPAPYRRKPNRRPSGSDV